MLQDFEVGHMSAVSGVCFAKTQEGQKLISGGNDRKIILWDWTRDDNLIVWHETLPDKINDLCIKKISENDEEIYVATLTGIYQCNQTFGYALFLLVDDNREHFEASHAQ